MNQSRTFFLNLTYVKKWVKLNLAWFGCLYVYYPIYFYTGPVCIFVF